jgi:hypothetical protein
MRLNADLFIPHDCSLPPSCLAERLGHSLWNLYSLYELVPSAAIWHYWLLEAFPWTGHGCSPITLRSRLVRAVFLYTLRAFVLFCTAVERFQRQRIERNLRAKLSREDALNIIDFYSRSPASGFFVVAMNEIPIGCVAVDAACPDENLVDVISLKEKDPELKPKKNVQKRKYATADHALIRHFHVDGPYRVTGISSDLLSYGLRHVFTAGKEVQKIYAPWSKLSPGLNPVWKEAGFKAVSDGWASKQGVENDGASRFVSSGKWVEIERAAWEKKQS